MSLTTFVLALWALQARPQPTASDGPQPAQNDDAKRRAETKLEEAERHYFAGDYPAAQASLEEAVALFPSPRLYFSFGLTHAALARDLEALEAFERFLAGTDENDAEIAEQRKEARTRVAVLGRRVATLELTCDTKGADVVVDGHVRGRTPLATPLRLAPGAHQIVVEKLGHGRPFVERIEPAGGDRVHIHARLPPALPIVAVPNTLAVAPVAAPTARPSFHRQWWFWTAVGAVVAGTATAIVLATRVDEPWCTSCAGTYRIP